MRGVIRRELDSNSRTSLTRIRYNFLGIRDKNINFILSQLQNRNSNYSFCNITQTFETDNEWNLHLYPWFQGNCTLFSPTRSRTRISFSLYHRPPLNYNRKTKQILCRYITIVDFVWRVKNCYWKPIGERNMSVRIDIALKLIPDPLRKYD